MIACGGASGVPVILNCAYAVCYSYDLCGGYYHCICCFSGSTRQESIVLGLVDLKF